jgi:hypothetical protein
MVQEAVRCLKLGIPIQHMDLKARQIGASTFWAIFYLDDAIFTPQTISYIVAQKRETLKLLWDVVKRAYRHMPAELRPRTTSNNANELDFGDIGSVVRVSLSVKSTTLHNLLVTEFALCDPEEIEQTLAAVPVDANVSLETVANGPNHAKDKWVEKGDGWTKVFHPWYRQPEYRLPVPHPLVWTEEELALKDKALRLYGIKLDDEQLAFRRKKKKDLKRKFAELYAEDDKSCFLATGDAYFDGLKLGVLIDEAMADHPDQDSEAEWVVFEKPQHKHIYVIGGDVAEGVGQDYSVLAVLCVTCRKVAARYRARCGVDSFYRTAHKTGTSYNNALLGIELNNHGHAVVMGLREKHYPNIYREEPKKTRIIRKPGDAKEVVKYGWVTTADSKHYMLDKLKLAIEGDTDEDEQNFEPAITWSDVQFLTEALGIREEDGKIEAVAGKHDDLVMAYAIAWQMFLRVMLRGAAPLLGGIQAIDELESA